MIISDRDIRIACLWLAGVKSDAIAAELGAFRASILRSAHKKLGLPRRLSSKSGHVNLWPCIVAWARHGYDPVEIAKGIGCTKPELVASIGAATCFATREAKSRTPAEVASRVRASKQAWVTRKRQKQAREAASVHAKHRLERAREGREG
jgi:hypothetical protein